MLARDGLQLDTLVYARVKVVLMDASLSKLGVSTTSSFTAPLVPTSVDLTSFEDSFLRSELNRLQRAWAVEKGLLPDGAASLALTVAASTALAIAGRGYHLGRAAIIHSSADAFICVWMIAARPRWYPRPSPSSSKRKRICILKKCLMFGLCAAVTSVAAMSPRSCGIIKRINIHFLAGPHCKRAQLGNSHSKSSRSQHFDGCCETIDQFVK
jgi:hypothetical protein